MDSQIERTYGETADHQQQPAEKQSVMKKVKARAKKIKHTISKHAPGAHGGRDHANDGGDDDQQQQHGREYHQVGEDVDDDEDDDFDDADEDMGVEDPHQVHGAPIYDESPAIRNAAPKQDVNKGEPEVTSGKVDAMEYAPPAPSNTPAASGTTRTRVNDDVLKNFDHGQEGNQGQVRGDSGRSTVLLEDPNVHKDRRESHDPANYQTKLPDPTGAGAKDAGITPILKSFGKMSVHDEPESKPHQNLPHDQHILPTSFGTKSVHDEPESKSHQNLPHDEHILPQDITNPKESPQNQSSGNSYTNKLSSATISAKNAVASKFGYGDKDDNVVTESRDPEHYQPTKTDSDQPHDITNPKESPQDQSSGNSYTNKLSSATISAKNVVASKLGYGGKDNSVVTESLSPPSKTDSDQLHDTTNPKESPQNQSSGSSYTNKLSSATMSAKNVVASKLGYGDKDNSVVTESRDQLSSELSPPSKTDSDQPHDTTNPKESPQNQSSGSSYTNKLSSATISAKNVVASKIGYGGKDDNVVTEFRESGETETAKSPSKAGNDGKGITSTITEKLSPVYTKVAGVGTTIMSKVTGTGTDTTSSEKESGVKGSDKNLSAQKSWTEKLKPGEEDKALSETISGLLHKPKEEAGTEHKEGKVFESEEVAKRLGTGDGHPTGESADSRDVKVDAADPTGANKGMVNMVRGAVGSWFGKGEVGQEGTEERRPQESSN